MISDYSKTFDWVQFPEGRARFSGGIRGWDEAGHETFAVELEGLEIFGEIKRAFLPNDNDFNIEIVSFGYGMQDNVGVPGSEARGVFTTSQLRTVKSLVCQLIAAGLRFERRPVCLIEYPDAQFMGTVLFPASWAQELSPDSLRHPAQSHDAGSAS